MIDTKRDRDRQEEKSKFHTFSPYFTVESHEESVISSGGSG